MRCKLDFFSNLYIFSHFERSNIEIQETNIYKGSNDQYLINIPLNIAVIIIMHV